MKSIQLNFPQKNSKENNFYIKKTYVPNDSNL